MLIFKSDQTKDTRLKQKRYSRFNIRYLYARSYDSVISNNEGQDYLAWRYTKNKVFDFVICDGVSGSFLGQIAAKYLGEQLLENLFISTGSKLENAQSESEISAIVTNYLNEWREAGQKKVEAVKLPTGLPPLVATALEGQRRDYGSETVFICGRLYVCAAQATKLILIWLGDTQVRLYDRAGNSLEIGGVWHNAYRWSTRFGIKKGEVQARIINIKQKQLERIIIFSDGFATIAEELYYLADKSLRQEVKEQFKSPSSDDISLIDIYLKTAEILDGLETSRR